MAGTSSVTQVVTNLNASTSYDFRVTATNVAGTGPASSAVTATTLAAPGSVASIVWNFAPFGSYTQGTGAIGVNAHVTPATAAIRFGFSTSGTTPPGSWTDAIAVNTDLWGAYVATPASAGTWYAWAQGTDGSSSTVYATPFAVT